MFSKIKRSWLFILGVVTLMALLGTWNHIRHTKIPSRTIEEQTAKTQGVILGDFTSGIKVVSPKQFLDKVDNHGPHWTGIQFQVDVGGCMRDTPQYMDAIPVLTRWVERFFCLGTDAGPLYVKIDRDITPEGGIEGATLRGSVGGWTTSSDPADHSFPVFLVERLHN
ncbi:hypothetical protein FEMY_24580 [Ferrovum myxofaciens]|uniref:Uncharacterized protein n=1 Tax=Ferrovum myxofaciens TaxID=416213 RepID=A0A149VUX3_9PROT|nr:hypothetical protein [Ferrovum myxofaciens]KXW57022.1 hypothetical protein FEMY_24580 [Ferrovum myxofaciens]